MTVPGASLQTALAEYIQYDPTSPTGLRWAKRPARRSRVGDPALTTINGNGYYSGCFQKRGLLAHRVVYFLVHGYWPEQVDHIDGDRLNNSSENLRAVTHKENQHNRIAKGYTERGGVYISQIKVGGKHHHLGTFTNAAAARQAYLNAKAELHPTAPTRCY